MKQRTKFRNSFMKNKKRTTKNLKITTRITLTTVLGIIVPLLIVSIFSSVFLTTMASYFNFSTVTTDSYSMLNQIQWSQTISSISNELVSDDSDEEKLSKTESLVSPIEKMGSKIYIGFNENEFYSTSNKKDVLDSASSIVSFDINDNLNYFGENGIVIVNHAEVNSGTYIVLITTKNYTVNNVSRGYTAQDFSSLVFGKTGLFLFAIILVFIISILILSLITSSTIIKPMKKLSNGANEIANGNLDYVIDFDSTNEIGETVSAFNNMTQRLKESLESQRKLEQSRKEMIAGMAHDIRTPLTSIKGYVEGLLDGIANTPEKQERYLKTIYSSTCDMEKLTNELLTISRLELGTFRVNTQPVSISEFMNDCAEEMSLFLERNNFDFVYQNNCNTSAVCDIDTDTFSRVIRNIVSNSIKYSKPNIKGKIEFFVEEYQKSVIITITDNGIGVDAETLPKIFDSFYRADKARTNTRDGSGLGLAICKQIIEQHKGRIWATSKEGEGLTMHISLEKRIGDENE